MRRVEHIAFCPHGDPYCPCQDGDACHYVAYGTSPALRPMTRVEIDRLTDAAQTQAAASTWHATEAERVLRHRDNWLAKGALA